MKFLNKLKSFKTLFAGSDGGRAQLQTAARFPELAQADYLRRLLRDQRDTAYGRAHAFDAVRSVADYQAQVPIVDYETLRPWLAEIERGIANVLVAEPVLCLRQSAGGSKRLPVTRRLQAEQAAALRPFLADWLALQKETAGRPWLWQALAADDAPSLGAVPLLQAAAQHPAKLLGGSLAAQLRGMGLCTPKSRGRARFTLLSRLLAQVDLAAMSLGDPVQAKALFDLLHTHLPELLKQLSPERRAEVAKLATQGPLVARQLWPQLQRVSLWQEGSMAAGATDLSPFFVGIALQTAPLQGAEATLTVPEVSVPGQAAQRGAPLALRSHFFEFIDLRQPRARPRLAHQLEEGGLYVPVVTTAGGLYRYRLQDVVECTGFWQRAPRLAFVDRARDDRALSDAVLQRAA